MFLTGPEIVRRRANGQIVIDPFDPAHVNPNSYDLTLGNGVGIYQEIDRWDVRNPPALKTFTGSDDGVWYLDPGYLYLMSTVERVGAHSLVPIINGKSSTGRLGLSIHCTAGFGDVGFFGTLTLEISVIHPLTVYAGMRICQISFQEVVGEIQPYRGRYQGQSEPTGCRVDALPNREQQGIL